MSQSVHVPPPLERSVCGIPPSKVRAREKIDKDIAEYLGCGNVIDVHPTSTKNKDALKAGERRDT